MHDQRPSASRSVPVVSNTDTIRTLIVDDERLARRRLRRLISTHGGFEVAGECAGGEEAVEFLRQRDVDLIFLDVQMPDLDGFAVLEKLGTKQNGAARDLPLVVFVTAYDEHALRAFDVHAFDYLLKPFDPARFAKTVDRVRAAISKQNQPESRDSQFRDLLQEVRTRPVPSTRFAIKTPGRVFFVRQEEIDWVEAADNYVCLHVGNDTHLLRETMNSIETRLDSERFARIHRSTIVNLDRVKELRPWFHGEYVVVLRNNAELTLSRSYRDRVLGILNAT